MARVEVKAGKNTVFNLGQDVPMAEQKWRAHLVLVTVGAEKLVGLASDMGKAKSGQPFILYGACTYEPPKILPQPTERGIKFQVVMPPLVLPFDGMDPATVRVCNWNSLLVLSDQFEGDDPGPWAHLFSNYQNIFDVSALATPSNADIAKIVTGT